MKIKNRKNFKKAYVVEGKGIKWIMISKNAAKEAQKNYNYGAKLNNKKPLKTKIRVRYVRNNEYLDTH